MALAVNVILAVLPLVVVNIPLNIQRAGFLFGEPAFFFGLKPFMCTIIRVQEDKQRGVQQYGLPFKNLHQGW